MGLGLGRVHGSDCARRACLQPLMEAALLKAAASPQFSAPDAEKTFTGGRSVHRLLGPRETVCGVQMALGMRAKANLTERMVLALSVPFS